MRSTFSAYWLLLLSVTWLAQSCTKERPPRPESPLAPAESTEVNVEGVSAPKKAPAPPRSLVTPPSKKVMNISAQEFMSTLEAVAPCEVTQRGMISRQCEAYQAYRLAKARRGPIERPWKEVERELSLRLLSHQDAAVRLVAAELMGPLLQASSEQLAPLIEATRREVHPGVVKSFVKRLGPSTYRHPEVRELMMVLGGHLDEGVRIEVANWLTSAQGRGTPDILERAMKMVREDPSERVSLRVLDDLGDSADERVLPFLEGFLSSSKTSPRRHASALRALINMWSSPIPKPSPSQAAYQRTLRLLRARPRSEASPPWAALGGLRWVTKARFIERAPWFERDALVKALSAIIVDPKASLKARSVSVELLVDYQERPERFATLLEECLALEMSATEQRGVLELLRAAAGKRSGAQELSPTP